MPKYIVLITKSVQKQLNKLPNSVAELLEEKMLQLEENPRPKYCKKLKSRNAYRIRVSNYRFIYDIQDNIFTVTVLKVSHRKNIYSK